MCEVTGQKTVDINNLKCNCGCNEVVVRSYAKQHRMWHKSSYISVGVISCKKCGEALLTWSM